MRSRLVALILLATLAGTAQALPEAARTHAERWRTVGQGEMRWFGLSIYSAQLWSAGEAFDTASVFALHLTYARDFKGQRIVDTTIDELQRLGVRDAALLARWRRELERAFPDVREGEAITGVHLPGRGAVFYHQGRKTAEIFDAAFAQRFFAIWLDARTREPELRRRLLGESP